MNDAITQMVSAPIEPDAAATMCQTMVNPGELVQNADEEFFRVLPNTLVFTNVVDSVSITGAGGRAAKRKRTEPERFAQVVGGAYSEKHSLYVMGVAYDGIPDAAAAKHWPFEKARLVVQVSGSVTIVSYESDLSSLEVLDQLQINREVPASNSGVASILNYNIPHLKKFDKAENQYRLQILEKIKKIRKRATSATSPTLPKFNSDDVTEIKDFMDNCGYEEFKNIIEDGKIIDDPNVKNFVRMVDNESRPFGILLEKGFECARILLTPA